jgi:glycogen debranching enzyme
MAAAASDSFNRLFWNDAEGCLYDVIDGERRDAAIRPNQIFAVSLRHSMLSATEAEQVVSVVERELWTPYGLRSLSPRDPNYVGRYAGGPRQRDEAYHQGTVWSWLMGPFITAYVKVHGGSTESRRRVGIWLSAFEEHLQDAGLGQISEIFDGDAPHEPHGCIAQAWSVAELLRAAIEDIAPRRARHNASVVSPVRIPGGVRR